MNLQRGFTHMYSAPANLPRGMGMMGASLRYLLQFDTATRNLGSGVKRSLREMFAFTENQKKEIKEHKNLKKIKFKTSLGLNYLLEAKNFHKIAQLLIRFETAEKTLNPSFSLRKELMKKSRTSTQKKDFLEMQYRLFKYMARCITHDPTVAFIVAEAIARVLTLDDESNKKDGFKMLGSFTSELQALIHAIANLVIEMESDPAIADLNNWEILDESRTSSRESPIAEIEDLFSHSQEEQQDLLKKIFEQFFTAANSILQVFVGNDARKVVDYTHQVLNPEITALQEFQKKEFIENHLVLLPRVIRFLCVLLTHDPRLKTNEYGEPDGSQSPELIEEMRKKNTEFKRGLYCLIKSIHTNSVRPDSSLVWVDHFIDYLRWESETGPCFVSTPTEDTENDRDLARYSILRFALQQFFPNIKDPSQQEELFEQFASLILKLQTLPQILGLISEDLISLLRLEENKSATRTLVVTILHHMYGYTPEQLITDINNNNMINSEIKEMEPKTFAHIIDMHALSKYRRNWAYPADERGVHFIDDLLTRVLSRDTAFTNRMIFEVLQDISQGRVLELLEKLFCADPEEQEKQLSYHPNSIAVFDKTYRLDLINDIILQNPAGFIRFLVKVLMQVLPPQQTVFKKTAKEQLEYRNSEEEILYQQLLKVLYPDSCCSIVNFERLLTGCADFCYGMNHKNLQKIQSGLDKFAPLLKALINNISKEENNNYFIKDIASQLWAIKPVLSRNRKIALKNIQPEEERKRQQECELALLKKQQEDLQIEFVKRLMSHLVEQLVHNTADFSKFLLYSQNSQHAFFSLPWFNEMIFSAHTSFATRKIITSILDACHSFDTAQQKILIQNLGLRGHALFMVKDLRTALGLLSIFVALGNYALTQLLYYTNNRRPVDFTAQAVAKISGKNNTGHFRAEQQSSESFCTTLFGNHTSFSRESSGPRHQR